MVDSFLWGGVGEITAASVGAEPNSFVARRNGVGFLPCSGGLLIGGAFLLIDYQPGFLGGDEVAQEGDGGGADWVVGVATGDGDGVGSGFGWFWDGEFRETATGRRADAGWDEGELIGFSGAGELADSGEKIDVEPADGFVEVLGVRVMPADDADAVFIDFCVEIEAKAALFSLAGEFFGGGFPRRAWLREDWLRNVGQGGGFATKDC